MEPLRPDSAELTCLRVLTVIESLSDLWYDLLLSLKNLPPYVGLQRAHSSPRVPVSTGGLSGVVILPSISTPPQRVMVTVRGW
jgi:hypothetical protein